MWPAIITDDNKEKDVREDTQGSARKKISAGSTLIERLTVVAIVGVLAALILPALTSAREQSRRATCLSNLRQLGQATQMYYDEMKTVPIGPYASGGASPDIQISGTGPVD